MLRPTPASSKSNYLLSHCFHRFLIISKHYESHNKNVHFSGIQRLHGTPREISFQISDKTYEPERYYGAAQAGGPEGSDEFRLVLPTKLAVSRQGEGYFLDGSDAIDALKRYVPEECGPLLDDFKGATLQQTNELIFKNAYKPLLNALWGMDCERLVDTVMGYCREKLLG